MLAYVFWHWKRADASADDYERAQRAFHEVLSAHPSPGFHRSWSSALPAGTPWLPAGGGYEDWYLLDGSASLDPLDAAAVSAARQAPHDAAAALAAGGTAGLYRLRVGAPPESPAVAHWFAKPAGMSYATLFETLAPFCANGGALWCRAMTLGPAREFCLHASAPLSLPPLFDVLALSLRRVVP